MARQAGERGLDDSTRGTVSARVIRPAEDLQSFITFFYFVEVDGPLSDFLYPEWGNVRFARGDWTVEMPGHYPPGLQTVQLYGPTDRTARIVTWGGLVFGFGITPIGWLRLFDDDAGSLANRVVPLGNRLGADADELRRMVIGSTDDSALVATFEALLRRRIESRPAAPAVMTRIAAALRERPESAAAMADASGLSERTLHRLCVRKFGFAPKRLLRRQRFLDTLGRVRSAVGGEIGSELGDDYVDAPHFYRDFRDFMAMSPRQYFSSPRPIIDTAAVEQVRAGVTLGFELAPPPGL